MVPSLQTFHEWVDANKGLKFKQVFRGKMLEEDEPVVQMCTGLDKKKGDYNKIAFSADLARFLMSSLGIGVALEVRTTYRRQNDSCSVGP